MDAPADRSPAVEHPARLALIGRLLESTIRQVGESLMVVSSVSRLLLDRAEDRRIRTDVEQIRIASAGARRVVATFARLSGGDGPAGVADLSQVAREALDLFEPELWVHRVAVRAVYSHRPARVATSPGLLLEAVLHLLLESADALAGPGSAPPGGRLSVATAVGGGLATLTVEHERGPGGPGATGRRGPAASTALDRCREIVEPLGGSLLVERSGRRPRGGERGAVRLSLPLAGTPARPARPRRRAPIPSRG